MQETSHLTPDVLEQFARGELDADQFLEVADHLERCPECARAGRARSHEDLSALRAELRQKPHLPRILPYRWSLAAAVVIVIAGAALLLQQRQNESRTAVVVPRAATAPRTVTQPARVAAEAPATYANAEWQRLFMRATESGRLPFPVDLDGLRTTPDRLRGSASAIDRVRPAGVVIDDVRPLFTWPGRDRGTYTVFVFDGEREILRSEPLQEARWTPARDLPRGRVLSWQVEIDGDAALETIPAPPTPPAMFRIVTEAEHEELARATREHPHDLLLLALLQARSGMRAEALASLRHAAERDPAARRILDHELSASP